ncbi:uncharacterized protein LOC112555329 isoform X2 [Pomacea canaliculata]|uniref:uncharacterized protein LOC112555329 isoform X2 n=1 Tax=Pomacea canaliculata TaxID=400727 RepID=UPI000D73E820|nr:uncharacterized protein LOC112555329 isoform X2 [Pomacea canaliculata]
MEKHSPSYIQTNHSSEDRDGENYRYFSIKFVKEIEYDDSSSSQEDLDHECREKVRRDWSLKDGSDVKDQQSKKNEEELEVKQLAAIPDTGVTNLIEAWRQQTSHFQTMVEKNDELLEMNLHLMQEMSTIKTSNVHLQEELADVRQYVENMKRDLKQMVPTSTHLSKKYQDLAVSTSDHATCSTASTSSYETTSTSTPTTPWFTVKDPKDDDNLQKNSDIICETPKTSTSGTCTETDKERSCTAISVQKTEKQNYLNSESSHSILMRKFSNDQSSSRTSFVSAVNFDNVILNAHAESNLPSGENTAVNGGQTNPDYRLTRNQFSNDHSNRTEDFTNAFWPIGDQDETPTAEIEDVLIRSSSSSKSSSLLQSSGSHDGSLSKRESWNQITGNRSVTFLDNVTSTSKMENVPEERSKNEDVLIRSSSSLKSSSLLQSSGSHDGSLSKRESWNQITGNRSVTFLDNVTSTSKMENVPEERNLSGTIQNITAASMSSSKEICVKDSIEEISSLSKQEDKFPFHDALISSDDAHHQSETPSGASGLLNERNDYVDKEPDASDYQNSSLKEKMPVSSSHEKVPLGRSGSPTTAAGPSVWNSDSSCGPLPSPPRYRFMFPCTVSILQEKVKQLRFNEKRAKSASGHEKDSSQRQSAGAHPQDGYQTSNSDRLITAREDGETNSSNLDIRQRDDSLDPRNAWKRLAKTYLSSRGCSRFADLSAQLLYASRIRNLQLATASRPATAPYQRTDSNPRSNGLLRTELSSQGLGTPDAKEVAGFSSSYICIFACHARLVRLDPRGIRCDNKMLHPSVEFVEVQILNLNEPGVYKVVMLSGARVCASHFISKSMILQSLGRSSLSAQKSRSLQETQRDGSVQGSVTRELNPSSSASQQQGKLDVKDRYKSGSRFAAVVEALRSSKATTTTTQEVTPGGSKLTLGSLGPGWIYTALDMSSKPLHMQCFVLVFPTQKLAIQFKAVFNRCREEVQQASDSILVALSTYGRRKTQENANWSCMHSDAGEGAAELMTSSEILKDCQRAVFHAGERQRSPRQRKELILEHSNDAAAHV